MTDGAFGPVLPHVHPPLPLSGVFGRRLFSCVCVGLAKRPLASPLDGQAPTDEWVCWITRMHWSGSSLQCDWHLWMECLRWLTWTKDGAAVSFLAGSSDGPTTGVQSLPVTQSELPNNTIDGFDTDAGRYQFKMGRHNWWNDTGTLAAEPL